MNAQLGTINVSRCVVTLMVAITVSATKATGLVRTESRVLVRHIVLDSRFDNLCGSHLQSQSELYHVSRWYYILWLLI